MTNAEEERRAIIVAADMERGRAYNRKHGTRWPIATPRSIHGMRGFTATELIVIDPIVPSEDMWHSLIPCLEVRADA